MTRSVGNPQFGDKYRFPLKGERPMTAQVKTQLDPEVKEQLEEMASAQKCTIPDLVRRAIDRFLLESVESK